MHDLIQWQAARRPESTIEPGQVHLWLIDLAVERRGCQDFLSSAEKRKAARYLDPESRRRYTNARGSMRTILGAYLDTPGDRLEIRHGRLGKPFIDAPGETDLSFNLSHCGDAALLAVHASSAIGVDLERIAPRPNARKIARRIFDSQLYNAIEPLPEPVFLQHFFTHWTALEARVKCQGLGVFSTPDPEIAVASFRPIDDHIAAVALPSAVPPIATWGKFRLSG